MARKKQRRGLFSWREEGGWFQSEQPVFSACSGRQSGLWASKACLPSPCPKQIPPLKYPRDPLGNGVTVAQQTLDLLV